MIPVLITLALLLCVVVVCTVGAKAPVVFDAAIANTSIWLSAGAYCTADNYLSRPYKGASAGFQPVDIIDVPGYDVQGFIGTMPSQEAIYIVFRGSSSIHDWINNLDTVLSPYPKCQGCEVHSGFYDAEQSVLSFVTLRTLALLALHPTYQIIATGHSLGAAIATLILLDLQDTVPSTVRKRLFNFGSPRVGNTAFAEYASTLLVDRYRVTFKRDAVPHLPWYRRFTHISGEWYEDDSGIHACTGFEDPNCADQWLFLSIDDHFHYLGVEVTCDGVE